MCVKVYGVILQNDNRILGLEWNKERAHKLIKNVNNLLAPHTEVGDYELIELMLPPFRHWIEDTIQERGLDVPKPHIVFNQDKSAHPGVRLLQAYLSTVFDPLDWAMELLSERDFILEPLGMTDPSRERVEAMTGD